MSRSNGANANGLEGKLKDFFLKRIPKVDLSIPKRDRKGIEIYFPDKKYGSVSLSVDYRRGMVNMEIAHNGEVVCTSLGSEDGSLADEEASSTSSYETSVMSEAPVSLFASQIPQYVVNNVLPAIISRMREEGYNPTAVTNGSKKAGKR